MRFHRGYALAAIALFLIEVAIALWVRDRFVRPVGGDILAVLLVYCALRAVTRFRVVPAALSAVGAGFAVEAAQALHLIQRLGLSDDAIVSTVAGTHFDVGDLVAYCVGGALALLIERIRAPSLT